LEKNSHDYPELKLNSSSIYFSGTEDSPEKMTIINTGWAVEFNYNKIYKEAFEACHKNSSCSKVAPSLIEAAMLMSDEIYNLDDGLSYKEKNEKANEYLDRVLFDDEYEELYREIFKFYDGKI
jgi:hypothetical protein